MSTQTKHYKQLTQGQRYQLQALLDNGQSQQAIADTLGVNKSTVSRELNRNSEPDGYCPEAAEKRKTERKKNAHKAKKTGDQHREFNNTAQPREFSWCLPSVNQLNAQLSMRVGLKNPPKTIFQRFGFKDEDGSDIYLTSHQLRVWLSTNAERGGMDAWQLARWAGRARIADNRHYDLRTQEEREEQVKAIMLFEERPTALEAIKVNLPVSYKDLGVNRIGIADPTVYGMCVHDFSMTPCIKGGGEECMTCKEHACIKGMPKTLERIKLLEENVKSQLHKAEAAAGDLIFGADRWVTHLGWKLAHIRTVRQMMESEATPEGTVIWIPPEHDPSPTKRALEQRDLKTKPDEEELVSESTIAMLMGIDNA